ncbi:Tn3 family transposase, partial [Pseudomonas aeruginosa]|uniref:Tn3 family transposase n=1 Tax=Pseudomonas aeruginosa TaxID=287 RepID=UPI0031B74EF6
QYAPFHTKVVNVGLRDSTYVLDGLLYHESDLRIEEHYTDTAGFTDHVFALMHLLGFRFAPRIRDLGETKLYVPNHIQDLKKTLHLKFLLRSCSVSIFAAWFDGHFSPSKRQPIPDALLFPPTPD